jgi:predicted NodU family carbamoyl transferase
MKWPVISSDGGVAVGAAVIVQADEAMRLPPEIDEIVQVV